MAPDKIHSEQLAELIKKHADAIYGVFLGNRYGVIYKEQVFNEQYCPLSILTNIINALCSFVEETNISDHATLQLSRTRVSFKKYKDAVFIIVHNISNTSIVFSILEQFATILEEKSRKKFYSEDQSQVFAGISSAFIEETKLYFKSAIETQRRIIEKGKERKEQLKQPQREIATRDASKVLEMKKKKISGSQKEVIKNLIVTLQLSFKGISHLVIVQHDGKVAKVFFEYGKLSNQYVSETMKIINKFLPDIIELMKDTSEENILEVSEEYQLVFTPMDGDHFLYIIAEKNVDLPLLQPVFRRIAKKINETIHEMY